MARSRTDDSEWQSHACVEPACGRQLQAPAGYCPFCGKAQAIAPEATKDARRDAGGTAPPGLPELAVPAAPIVPIAASEVHERAHEPPPTATVASQPAVPQGPPPAPPREPPGATTPHQLPADAVATQGQRRWPRALWGLLILAGVLFWLRPHDQAQPPVAVEQCHALTTEARVALAAGDVAAANSSLAKAESACGAEQRNVIDVLEKQLGTLKAQVAACAVLEKKLHLALSNGRPRDVSAQMTKAPHGCSGEPAIATLVERSVRQIEQATVAVNGGFGRLNSGDLDGADALLASALRSDRQAGGAEALRKSLAKARQAAVPDAGPSAPATPVVKHPPAVRERQAAAPIDSVLDGLLGDGRQALQRKNYAGAKNAARSALRLSPGSQSAQALLREAEDGEREALQSMEIH